MSNKKNSGEAANVEDLPDGKYEIYNNLEGILDYEGVGYVEKNKIYPILVLVRHCDDQKFRLLRIKPEDIGWSRIPLYDLEKDDTLIIKKGKIISVKD